MLLRRETFGNSSHGGRAKQRQIERSSERGCPHAQFPSQARGHPVDPVDLAGRRHAGLQRPAAGRRLVKHLPLFFDLAGRKVVVVGEGPAADRRAELARSAGADVARVAADGRGRPISAALPRPSSRPATLERDTAAQRVAKAAGVPVNVADRPALCDFILPAIVDRDGVVVAISTGGASPTLAQHSARPHRGGAAGADRRPGEAGQDLPRPGQCPDRRPGPPPRLLAPPRRGAGGAAGAGRRRCRRPARGARRTRRRPPPPVAGRHRPYRRRRSGRSRPADACAPRSSCRKPMPSCTTSWCRLPSSTSRAAMPSWWRSASARAARAGRRPTSSRTGRRRACRPDRRAAEGGRSLHLRPRRRGGRSAARRRSSGVGRAGHHRGAGLRGLGRHSPDPSPSRLGRRPS